MTLPASAERRQHGPAARLQQARELGDIDMREAWIYAVPEICEGTDRQTDTLMTAHY